MTTSLTYNSISQPQYAAAVKLTSPSALFPANIDCKQSVYQPTIVQNIHSMQRYLSFNPGRAEMKLYLNISLSDWHLLSKCSVDMLGEKRVTEW